jgi:CDP-glucose 4,6-dehydratase
MMQHFSGAYQGKKVFLTGHTGFKGSWMCIWLLELGAKVYGYSDNVPTNPSNFEASGLSEKLEGDFRGDIRDISTLSNALNEVQPDIVFHMAAQPLVRLSYREPLETLSINIMGTATLLEACRHIDSIQAVINVTSDKCYENREWPYAYRENDPMGGYDPYSASKGAAELVASSFERAYYSKGNCRLASVRAGNVIGGGDWAEDRLIPDCARALSKDQPITLRNPRAIRPWQLVIEPVGGYLWLGAHMLNSTSKKDFSGGWNFGPATTDAMDVEDIATLMISAWGKGQLIIDQDPNAVHEANYLKLDCSKAHQNLGWRAVYGPTEAISESAKWYARFYENESSSMYDTCVDQINRYAEAAASQKQVWALETQIA